LPKAELPRLRRVVLPRVLKTEGIPVRAATPRVVAGKTMVAPCSVAVAVAVAASADEGDRSNVQGSNVAIIIRR